MKCVLIVLIALVSAVPVYAQVAMPPSGATPFKDTHSLKPPPGAKIALIEFEDLECPLCARVSPLVREASRHYQIPLLHRDFIIQSHTWSRSGAIYARYLEDNVSKQMAEDFRRDVFANQRMIASREDLQEFARKWYQSHGQQMPFVIDPSGQCAREVEADCTLGVRLGIQHTPTLIVVTSKEWIEVTDPDQLYAAVDRAELDTRSTGRPPRPTSRP